MTRTRVRASASYEAAIERARALDGFQFLATKRFSCKNFSNDIALFEHLQTGLVFNLIPGNENIPPFLLCQTPCTQLAWLERARGSSLNLSPSCFHSQSSLHLLAGQDLPVEQVSWLDCQEWLALQADGLRLPYEAEWEHGCRAGSTSTFFFGEDESELDNYAWYSKNSDNKTHPVGLKLPNAFGLYDIVGNVWEWNEDEWSDAVKPVPFVASEPAQEPARSALIGAAAGAATPGAAAPRSAPRSAATTGRRSAPTTSASAPRGRCKASCLFDGD